MYINFGAENKKTKDKLTFDRTFYLLLIAAVKNKQYIILSLNLKPVLLLNLQLDIVESATCEPTKRNASKDYLILCKEARHTAVGPLRSWCYN